jgi:hypothetical protein
MNVRLVSLQGGVSSTCPLAVPSTKSAYDQTARGLSIIRLLRRCVVTDLRRR